MINIVVSLIAGTLLGYRIKATIDTYKNIKKSKKILNEIINRDNEIFEPIHMHYDYIYDNSFTKVVYQSNTTKPTLKETLKQQLNEAIEKEDYLLAKEIHNKINLLS